MSIIAKNTTGSDITIAGQVISAGGQYTLQQSDMYLWASSDLLVTKIGSGDIVINDGTSDLSASNGIDHVKGYQQKLNIDNNRVLTADNRIPPGYTLYVTGIADNISSGAYGGGTKMSFDSTNHTLYFQMLSHFYVIGVKASWNGCTVDNYMDATMIAPASSGFTNASGDYDKVEIIPSSGLHLFKPVTAGTGAWTGTLTDTLTNTNILKATPVPSTGNVGWFDYDSTTNTLTANMSQTGGYNLYDFDVNLHAFGRHVWGRAGSSQDPTSELDIPGLVGKLIFNSWKVKFEFKKDGGSLASEKVRLAFILGTKQNI